MTQTPMTPAEIVDLLQYALDRWQHAADYARGDLLFEASYARSQAQDATQRVIDDALARGL